MGSQIEVNSELKKGSQFSFCLKLDTRPNASHNTAHNVLENTAEQPRSLNITAYLTHNKEFSILDNCAISLNHEINILPITELNDINPKASHIYIIDADNHIDILELLLIAHKKLAAQLILITQSTALYQALPASSSLHFLHRPYIADDLQSLLATVAKTNMQTKAPTENITPLKDVTILIAEDNEINAEIAKSVLVHLGAQVSLAENGQIAVDQLLTEHAPNYFDLILMDIQMPIMDGVTATHIIRQQPNFKKLPIIAMTAHVMPEEVASFLSAGMNAHVGKPFDPKVLTQTILQQIALNLTIPDT